jgi:LysM repeat protein
VGLPSLIAFLLIAVLGGQLGWGTPLGWFQRQMDGGLQVINNIAITPVRTEDGSRTQETPESNGSLIALRPLALPAVTQGATAAAIEEESVEPGETPPLPNGEPEVVLIDENGAIIEPVGEEAAVEPLASLEPIVMPSPTDAPLPTETATPTETPTEIPTEIPTETPTETPLPTQTPAPTNTAAATNTPVALARAATATPTRTAAATATTTVAATLTSTPTAVVSEQVDIRATLEAIRASVPSPTATPTLTPVPSASYTIKTGDTLVAIAERFGIPMQTLIEANGLTAESAADLQVGRVLVLPGISSLEDESTQSYVVRAGDTLVGIALRFNVSTEALLRVNGLAAADARTIQVGQVIVIPTANVGSNTLQIQPMPTAVRPTVTPTPAPVQYTVRAGDTVVGIAQRFGTTTQALLALNNLNETQARRLRPGDLLLIPQE